MFLKSLFSNSKTTSEQRQQLMFALGKYPRNSSPVRVKRRCIITSNALSVVKDFRMNRMMMKNLFYEGMLNGVKKSSW